MSCYVAEATEVLEIELVLQTFRHRAELILQPFRHFTYVTPNSPTLPSLHRRHSSFSNPSITEQSSFSNLSVTSPMSQLTFNPSVTLPMSQLILQPFRHFTYVTAPFPTLPSLYQCHSSFSSPSAASPKSQVILQPFRCFTYVTDHFPTLLSLLLRHRIFNYVTWRAAHVLNTIFILSHNIKHSSIHFLLIQQMN